MRLCRVSAVTAVSFPQPAPRGKLSQGSPQASLGTTGGVPGGKGLHKDLNLSISAVFRSPRFHISPCSAFSNSLNILTLIFLPNSAPCKQMLESSFSLWLTVSSFQASCLLMTSVLQWVQEKSSIFRFSSFFLAVRVGHMFFPVLYSHWLKLEVLWFLLINICS